MKKIAITGPARRATPFVSPLDTFKELYKKGVPLKTALRRCTKDRGYPLADKEIQDAVNWTKHTKLQYIKPRVEPTTAGDICMARLSKKEQHDRHKAHFEKTGYWGAQAAGCLFLAMDTKRLLFAKRSSKVTNPKTWSTWGGAIDQGETPARAVMREIKEEAQYNGTLSLIALEKFDSGTGFIYHNFLCIVPKEFEPDLNWETSNFKWVPFGKWPKPLHPGAEFLLKASGNKIKEISNV